MPSVNPESPAGSTIECVLEANAVTYSWRPARRHPVQWIPTFFGSFVLAAAIVMPILILNEVDREGQFPLKDALMMGGILLVAGGFLVYSGVRIRGRESLKLTADEIEFDTGPSVLPVPLILWLGPIFLFGPRIIGGTTTLPIHLRRQKHRQSIEDISEFVLERVGERQRLRVDFGADRIEIGNMLREPEREWLGAQLNERLALNKSN